MSQKNRFPLRLVRNTEGNAVEFAIVLPILLVLLTGMIDFGHAWFMRQIVTNASREGARVGVVYQPSLSSAEKETLVRNTVTDYLNNAGLTATAPATVAGAAGASGNQLTVTVSATKNWWIVNKFIPGLGDSVNITSQTSMRLE
jgi:Flp pilus assembly protein TadG